MRRTTLTKPTRKQKQKHRATSNDDRENDDEQGKQLLHDNPQLAYAMFQGVFMLNLVDPAVLQVRINVQNQAPTPTLSREADVEGRFRFVDSVC